MTAPVILEGLSALGAASELRAGFVRALERAHQRHGPLVVLRYPRGGRFNGAQLALVADPRIARGVLMDPASFTSPGTYPRLGPPGCSHRRLREGIVLAKGDEHARQRRRLLPPLAPAAVDAMRPRIVEICEQESSSWPSGAPVDIVPLVKRLLRRISLELLFGETDLALGLEVGATLERHADLSLSLQAILLPLDWPGSDFGRLMRQAERTEAVLTRWVAERRRRPAGADLLSSLLADESGGCAVTHPEAAAQLWTLYGATFHTVSAALGWLMLLLAQHPQEAARVGASFEAPGRQPDQTPRAAIDAIQEAMRLLTPVPFQMRQAAGEVTLPLTDLRLSGRDTVVLSALAINRNADAYGPDPLAFRPARWRDRGAPQAELLIFSGGPRACPGRAFAFAVLGSALEAIWRRWRVRLAPGERLDYRTAITMSAKRARVVLEPPGRAHRRSNVTGPALRLTPALAGV